MYEKSSYRWIDLLPEALFSYRITVGVTKKTPFEIFFFRTPNFVYSYPGTNLAQDFDIEDITEGDRENVQTIHAALIQDVREQREANGFKMKHRWDTKNTQQVEVLSHSLFTDSLIHSLHKHFIMYEAYLFIGESICSCRSAQSLQGTS